MNNQNTDMDLGLTYQDCALSYQGADSNFWIQTSDSDEFLVTPESPLQPLPGISTEACLLNDVNKGEGFHGKRKAHDVREEEPRSEGMIKGRASTREKLTNKLKRTQSAEVHNVSERRRRDRIKGNVRALQELMPHCKKKDRASILEDAAEYIKTLKLQFNMMTKPAEAECLAPYTSCSQNPVMQFPNLSSFVPMGPGIGMGSGMAYGAGMLGLGFYAQSAPLIQVPVLGLSPSAVAGFPFPTICAPRVVESTTVNSSGETGAFCEPNPTRVFGSYTAAATCSSSGLGADGLSLRKKRRNIY